jgi:hypothetical protein
MNETMFLAGVIVLGCSPQQNLLIHSFNFHQWEGHSPSINSFTLPQKNRDADESIF